MNKNTSSLYLHLVIIYNTINTLMSYSPLGGSMAALFTEVVKSTIKVRIHKYIEWQLVKIIIDTNNNNIFIV